MGAVACRLSPNLAAVDCEIHAAEEEEREVADEDAEGDVADEVAGGEVAAACIPDKGNVPGALRVHADGNVTPPAVVPCAHNTRVFHKGRQ